MMLTRATTKALPRLASSSWAARRAASTATSHAKGAPDHSFSKSWLSDPSTYPILSILGIAMAGCGAFIGYKFMYCPDVRMSGKTKGQTVRTW